MCQVSIKPNGTEKKKKQKYVKNHECGLQPPHHLDCSILMFSFKNCHFMNASIPAFVLSMGRWNASTQTHTHPQWTTRRRVQSCYKRFAFMGSDLCAQIAHMVGFCSRWRCLPNTLEMVMVNGGCVMLGSRFGESRCLIRPPKVLCRRNRHGSCGTKLGKVLLRRGVFCIHSLQEM